MRIVVFFIFIWLVLALGGCKKRVPTFLDRKVPSAALLEDFDNFERILKSVHPGLYLYTTQKEWEHQFDSVQNLLKKDATVVEFYNKLSGLTNNVHCGHTSLFLPAAFNDSLRRLKVFFPIPLSAVGNQLVVNSTSYNIPLGAEILSINGDRVEKLLPNIWKYETVDGYNTMYQQEEGVWDFSMNYFLLKGPQKEFKIRYKTTDEDEHIDTKIIEPETFAAAADANFTNRYYYFAEDVNYDMDIIDSTHTAIMTVYTFGYDTYSTDRAFTRFVKNSFRLLQRSPEIKNLVIDLRNNTGGNFHDMFYLYGYLTRKQEWKEFKSAFTVFNKIPYLPYLAKGENDIEGIQASLDSSFAYKRTNGQSRRQYTDNETQYAAAHPFTGKVYVITNTNVQSAASYFASLLQDEGRAKIIGSETGGSANNTNSFHVLTYELPNTHIRLNVPVVHAEFSLQKTYAGGRGVLPDYPVPLTLADLKNNTDPQLGFVLDSLINR